MPSVYGVPRSEVRANYAHRDALARHELTTFCSTRDFDRRKFKSVKKTLKWLATLFLLVIVTMGGCLYCLAPRPPKEAKLIQNFNEHRAAFEQLRDMLMADAYLRRVASWGVDRTKPFFLGYPSEGNFPIERFNKHLALLKQVDGTVAYRNEGEHPNPGILIWGWGWAGNTKHIGICWLDQAPTNQIATLDGYHSQGPDRQSVFKHIDENWYLWSDQ